MHKIKQKLKIICLNIFVISFIFFSTLEAKNLDKFIKANNISDYFSGILLLNQNKYDDSHKYFKKLHGLEKSHLAYSSLYLNSLINSGNFLQAYNFSKKLEKDKKDSFESNFIIGIYHLKNSKLDLANKYFLRAGKATPITLLDNYVLESLNIWSRINISDLEESTLKLNQLDDRFENLNKIQKVFLNCYFSNPKTELIFNDLVSDQNTDFSRYNYFYAKFLFSINKKDKAKKIIENSLKKYPRNLLLNQYKIDLDNSKNNFTFDCKKIQHVVAEILYINANALSSQSFLQLSNFYLNLSKILNNEFHAFDTLMAENFYKVDDYFKAKEIYEKLSSYGKAFKWYSYKQISRILIKEENKNLSLKLLSNAYEELPFKSVYETFDYAEFLKNNEEFDKAIIYYTQILENIDDRHPLYPDVTDSRGVSYERTGNWEKAELDLISSLKIKPNQAYVINYLAYSWIEQGIKINESLKMLEKANKLKSNDPFIIDSLGWALFKLERYKESKDYLQLAVNLMPADPIVNDHFGDALWKNGNELQARYYWNYVLNLKKTEKDLKEKIKKKLIKGL